MHQMKKIPIRKYGAEIPKALVGLHPAVSEDKRHTLGRWECSGCYKNLLLKGI